MTSRPADRAQSETLGVVLVLAVVLVGVVAVVLAGGAALTDTRSSAALARAEDAMAQVDSRTSAVALDLDGGARATVPFGDVGATGSLRWSGDSRVRAVVVDGATGATTATLVDTTLGSVVYRVGGATVAYEGGGVWRSDGGSAVMLSPPEFHFRNGTLTVPVLALDGDGPLGDRVAVSRVGPPDRRFPDPDAGLTNRLEDAKVRVTVTSHYYRAWGRYFARETGGLVTYDHAAESVTVTFLALPRRLHLYSGIVGTTSSGELRIEGNGAYTDSYDSSVAPYSPSTATDNGTVSTPGDVTTKGDAAVHGNVRSGGTVSVGGSSTIDGSVYWTEGYDPGGTVTGSVEQIEGVPTLEPIDRYVAERVAAVRADNDNAATPVVEDGHLAIGGDSATLGAGTYYLENLSLPGKKLVLDTSGGNVTIAVRDYVSLSRVHGSGGNLTVTGGGTARVFVAGEHETTVTGTGAGERDVNLYVGRRSSVWVPGTRAAGLRVFGPRSFAALIASDNSPATTRFVGVVYAPAGLDGSGYVHVKQADVYGAVVTGSLTVGQYGAIHYDQALSAVALPRAPLVSRIEFMHVTVHPVRVGPA